MTRPKCATQEELCDIEHKQELWKIEMRQREPYRNFIVEVITYALRDHGYTAHFSIEKHDGAGVLDTYFATGTTYSTEQAAVNEALTLAKRKIDSGFEAREAS